MRRALREYKIAGVRTTIPFFETLLRHPDFEAGRLHTHFIAEHKLIEAMAGEGELPVAVIAAATLQRYLERPPQTGAPATNDRSAWKESGRFLRRFAR